MGTLYFAVNHERKELALLGKWSILLDMPWDGPEHVLNLSEEAYSACDGTSSQEHWRDLVKALRAFNCQEIMRDSEDTDSIDDYTIVIVRHPEDLKYIGMTLGERYDSL